jgi:hypothetical protein
MRSQGDRTVFRELPIDYYRQAPYSDDLEENYRAHCDLQEGER